MCSSRLLIVNYASWKQTANYNPFYLPMLLFWMDSVFPSIYCELQPSTTSKGPVAAIVRTNWKVTRIIWYTSTAVRDKSLIASFTRSRFSAFRFVRDWSTSAHVGSQKLKSLSLWMLWICKPYSKEFPFRLVWILEFPCYGKSKIHTNLKGKFLNVIGQSRCYNHETDVQF